MGEFQELIRNGKLNTLTTDGSTHNFHMLANTEYHELNVLRTAFFQTNYLHLLILLNFSNCKNFKYEINQLKIL